MIQKFSELVLVLMLILQLTLTVNAQPITPYAYDTGTPNYTDYYVDSTNGSDSNSGLSMQSPWKTVQHAWNQIPESTALTQGFRFNLMNGTYGNDELPNYWELKQGTESAPIILTTAPENNSVVFTRDINMANVSYFYLIGINIIPEGGGDAFHCESCDHLLIRGCVLNGGSTTDGAHETLKVNQSQYVYIENNNIFYADDNNIDFVGVQYGHIIGNKVHDASDWCAYVKGGSAYIRIESNEFYNCGTGGFTAGQGSGFQFMTSPWLHYEAYDIKFINNIIHDTDGAAIGINGGYNVLVAHNTAFKTGTRDHLLEVVFGERTCDGEQNGDPETTCSSYNTAGGWGPDKVHTDAEPVGNKNVFIVNNIFYNPSGTEAAQHFAIYGPRTPSSGLNLTSPQVTDDNLVISGNLVWNGNNATPVGIEDTEQGCQNTNTTCNLSQILNDNQINDIEPELQDLDNNDFRPTSASNLFSITRTTLPNFTGGDSPNPPTIPGGILLNGFTRDFSGAEPTADRIIGAFARSDSSLSPPAIDDVALPDTPDLPPTISNLKIKQKRKGKNLNISIKLNSEASETISEVSATINRGSKNLSNFLLTNTSGSLYSGKTKVKSKPGKNLTVTIEVTAGSLSTSKTSKIRSK